jgi:hypothetical protein
MTARTRVGRLGGVLVIGGLALLCAASLATARTHAGIVTANGTEICGSQTFPVTERLMGNGFTITSPGGTSTGTKSGNKINADGTGGTYVITVIGPKQQNVSETFRGQTCTGTISLSSPLALPTTPTAPPETPTSPPETEPPSVTPPQTSSESSDWKPLWGGVAALGGATALSSMLLHDDDKKKKDDEDDDDDDDDVGPIRVIDPERLREAGDDPAPYIT